MVKAVEIGLIEGAEIGKDKVMVSHLQYADDTIFTCNGKLEILWRLKELYTGLN
ncbi:hypothetical protein ACS0TY_014229 [Phlomoides rotata]